MSLVLLVMILLFSLLTSVPFAVVLSTRLSVRSLSSPLLPPMRSMLFANRGLHLGLPPTKPATFSLPVHRFHCRFTSWSAAWHENVCTKVGRFSLPVHCFHCRFNLSYLHDRETSVQNQLRFLLFCLFAFVCLFVCLPVRCFQCRFTSAVWHANAYTKPCRFSLPVHCFHCRFNFPQLHDRKTSVQNQQSFFFFFTCSSFSSSFYLSCWIVPHAPPPSPMGFSWTELLLGW